MNKEENNKILVSLTFDIVDNKSHATLGLDLLEVSVKPA